MVKMMPTTSKLFHEKLSNALRSIPAGAWRVVELGESTKGFQDGQHVPGLIAPDSKQSERIYTLFKTCRNMNCVTPRTVWPNEDSFCDDPNRQ